MHSGKAFFLGPGHGAGFYASEPLCISTYLLILWSCALTGRFSRVQPVNILLGYMALGMAYGIGKNNHHD